VAVGVGVTVLSAILPARSAVRIPPVAALVEQSDDGPASLRRRGTGGSTVALAGVAALAAGLARPGVLLVGIGAVAVFVAAGMLVPPPARPPAGGLRRPP